MSFVRKIICVQTHQCKVHMYVCFVIVVLSMPVRKCVQNNNDINVFNASEFQI